MTQARCFLLIILLLGCASESSGDAVDVRPADATEDVAPAKDDIAAVAVPLDELLAAYEEGALSIEALRGALATTTTPAVDLLEGRQDDLVFVRSDDGAVAVGDSFSIGEDGYLVLGPGVELVLAEGMILEIAGALYALGSPEAPVIIRGGVGAAYDSIVLQSRALLVETQLLNAVTALSISGESSDPVLIANCHFDHWSDLALSIEDRDEVLVRGCAFGLDTPVEEQEAETVGGLRSGVVFEDCVFGERRGYRDVLDLEDCLAPPYPVLRGCRFLGGEDDAIDLDDCHALVVGNDIRNFRPADLDAPRAGVNGGGITGDRGSQPLIVNNVIAGCYHAVGFKNGARPVLVNNTIFDSNIGVTLYQGDADSPQPHGVLINNILWNNCNWDSGVEQDIVLNGQWWPSYYQDEMVQATLEADHNLLATSFDGEGNLVGDPQLIVTDGPPVPSADSPAMDSGRAGGFEIWLDGGPFSLQTLLDELSVDFRGQRRSRDGDTMPGIDRGAVERGADE